MVDSKLSQQFIDATLDNDEGYEDYVSESTEVYEESIKKIKFHDKSMAELMKSTDEFIKRQKILGKEQDKIFQEQCRKLGD